MPITLMQLTLAIEPDRQQLARFVLSAVEQLNGNSFVATPAVNALLNRLRLFANETGSSLEVELRVNDSILELTWGTERFSVCHLGEPPTNDTLRQVATVFSNATETTDPELLRRRNEQIAQDLEQAKLRANAELAQLESALDKKKHELQQSIRLAESDGLTEIFNRGAYERRLKSAIVHSRRQIQPLSLLLLDVDNFKEVNDTHGHQYGDELLKRTADSISVAIRDDVDIACRIGGDEFAAIIFADLRIACRIANKIVKIMNGSISIGVSTLSMDDEQEAFVARADKALYRAKKYGKGRYEVDDSKTMTSHLAAGQS
ncbi:MAG: GGDEF domain-containing protein [Acidiferrobacterales bacterium]